MRESEFIRRVAEAESVIRYTFRLEIPEAEQRLKGDLVACSLDQAYRMTESLFSNYWKNRPFHINDKRTFRGKKTRTTFGCSSTRTVLHGS